MRFRHTNINEDMSYRDHVVNNEEEYVRDFLGPFSEPILQYVGQKIMNVPPVERYNFEEKTYYKDYASPIVGEYYVFIAARFPGDEKKGEPPILKPQWNALGLYSAENKCTLFNYVKRITIRKFVSIVNKVYNYNPEELVDFDEVRKDNEEFNIKDPQFEVFAFLQQQFYDQDLSPDYMSEEIQADLKNAMTELKGIKSTGEENQDKRKKYDGERDYRVLQLSYMYDYDWDDVADELRDYFKKPFSGPLEDLSADEKKDIQSRIAQWKKRAIFHLTRLICDSDKYSELKDAIIRHNAKRTTKKK